MSDIVEVPDDELAHFGVKGMRWGHRKAPDDSGSSGSSSGKSDSGTSKPTFKEKRAMNKAARREDNLKLVKQKQKAQTADDQKILDARARMNRVQQEYKDAKSQYKIDKQEVGRVAAKRALKEAGQKKAETLAKADQLTKAERKVYNTLLAGEALAALITRDTSEIDSSNPMNEFRRRVQAMEMVEAASR